MAAELRAHIDGLTDRYIARGMPPQEARNAALRAFGGLAQIEERCRDERTWTAVEQLWRDVRHAARLLLKAPVFTAVAIVSLALGIGASTAVFSIANAILLRSLPVPNPEQLRVLHWSGNEKHIPSWAGGDTSFTPPHFFLLRKAAAESAELLGYVPVGDFIVRGSGEPFSAAAMMVSDNYFAGLGVQPLLGRGFVSQDFAGGGSSVVLSYNAWETHFDSDLGVLGRTVSVNGTVFTIAGVLPPGFRGTQAGHPADFFVPLAPNSPFLYREITSNFHWYLRMMARLKPGANEDQLHAQLSVVWAREAAEYMQSPSLWLEAGTGGEANDRGGLSRPLLLLFGVVAAVMLITCANLAGLSLARGAARQHELAIRAALGSGRWRLVRQSLVESLLLASLGGCAGILVAFWV